MDYHIVQKNNALCNPWPHPSSSEMIIYRKERTLPSAYSFIVVKWISMCFSILSLSVSLSVSICLSICLSVRLSICLSLSPCVFLQPDFPFPLPPLYVSVRLFGCLILFSLCLSVSVCVCVSLSITPYLALSIVAYLQYAQTQARKSSCPGVSGAKVSLVQRLNTPSFHCHANGCDGPTTMRNGQEYKGRWNTST